MKNKLIALLLALLMITIGAIRYSVTALDDEREYGVDLAFSRRVVSTPHTDDNNNTKAVDANPNTRYASAETDNAFFYVDLGSVEKVGKIVIDWEVAYAAKYEIQFSLDAVNWTTVARVTNNSVTVDEIILPAWVETQFVRMQGIKRATGYGYSFYSFEVYGPKNLAVGGEILEVSSNENETNLNKQYMVDNLAHTRWASGVADNQYFLLDLKENKTFDTIKIRWEVSFGRRFKIYAHPSADTAPNRNDPDWQEIAGTDAGLGEVDTFRLDEDCSTRFIKAELIQRETSEETKKKGRYPWESTFSIYSFELFDWDEIKAVPLGNVLEFSKNSPAWTTMSNITLYDGGLILAPIGYPTEADGVVTNLDSIKSGDIPGFESYATYNPAVIYDEEREMFHMIYRAELPDNFAYYFMGDGRPKYELGHMSTLAYAYSYDGVNFIRGDNNPIAWPTSDDEKGGGLEDPRMFKIVNDPNRGGKTTYYVTYTMYDNHVTREGIMYTHDFVTFHKVGRLSPDYSGAIKSGAYVTDPEGNAVLINDPRPGKTGKVYVIYMKDGGYTRIGFTKDVLRIEAGDIVDIDTGGFGNNHIEALTKGNESCMAITNIYGPDDEDIYLMYGGGKLSDESIMHQQPNATGWFYALGALKTTKSNPFELTNYKMDLDEPTMYPTDTNKIDYGLFNKCMFTDCMIRHENKWYLYYGAGDMYVGLALARGDFGAGAAVFELTDNVLTARTFALNKKYGADKSDYLIELVSEVYDLSGEKLGESVEEYAVSHFSRSPLGIYSPGEEVSVSVDLSDIDGLTEEYYVISYIRDADTKEIINNPSAYAIINAEVRRQSK